MRVSIWLVCLRDKLHIDTEVGWGGLEGGYWDGVGPTGRQSERSAG